MEEKQLIKKLETLKAIKPNQNWVVLTKEEIMKKEPVIKSENNWAFLFSRPIKRPALVYAFRGTLVVMILLVGVLFYMNYLSSQTSQIFSNLFKSNGPENEKIIASISEIKTNLEKINLSLTNLENIKNPKDALTMTGVIKATAERNKELVEDMKKSSDSQKVYASLGEIEDTLGDINKKSYAVQKEIVEKIFEDLKGRSLSDENKERLDKAIEYYQEGKEDEAIILIIRILEN